MKRVRLPLFLTAIVLMLSIPGAGMAEMFSDIYIGAAFTNDETITIAGETGNISGELDFGDSFEFGYRIGYWFNRIPWLGLALDVSYFEHDIDSGDLMILPVSPLLMLRMPLLKSNLYPTGEWQPYAAAGPGLFYSSLEIGSYDDDQFEVGLDVRAGLKKMFTPNFCAFIEYRYSSFSTEFKSPVINEIDIETHHALIGIGVNF